MVIVLKHRIFAIGVLTSRSYDSFLIRSKTVTWNSAFLISRIMMSIQII